MNFSTIQDGTIEVFNINGNWHTTVLSESEGSQMFFTKIIEIVFPNYFS